MIVSDRGETNHMISVILQGMQELVKSRPEDPFEALAEYLRKHNPRKQKNAS